MGEQSCFSCSAAQADTDCFENPVGALAVALGRSDFERVLKHFPPSTVHERLHALTAHPNGEAVDVAVVAPADGLLTGLLVLFVALAAGAPIAYSALKLLSMGELYQ